MKIPLNMGQDRTSSTRQAQGKVLEHDILAAKSGDWNAKNSLFRTFTPLIRSLAEKRCQDVNGINKCMEAGKEGLFVAARKYKASIGADRFRIFALDFIEAAMDGKPQKGFLARLFGG